MGLLLPGHAGLGTRPGGAGGTRRCPAGAAAGPHRDGRRLAGAGRGARRRLRLQRPDAVPGFGRGAPGRRGRPAHRLWLRGAARCGGAAGRASLAVRRPHVLLVVPVALADAGHRPYDPRPRSGLAGAPDGRRTVARRRHRHLQADREPGPIAPATEPPVVRGRPRLVGLGGARGGGGPGEPFVARRHGRRCHRGPRVHGYSHRHPRDEGRHRRGPEHDGRAPEPDSRAGAGAWRRTLLVQQRVSRQHLRRHPGAVRLR